MALCPALGFIMVGLVLGFESKAWTNSLFCTLKLGMEVGIRGNPFLLAFLDVFFHFVILKADPMFCLSPDFLSACSSSLVC